MKAKLAITPRITMTPKNAAQEILELTKAVPKNAFGHAIVEKVDPALAQALLLLDVRNRDVVPGAVNTYAIYMITGKWILSPEALCFDIHGHLINGQHLLYAIISSKKPSDCVICCGCDEKKIKKNKNIWRKIGKNASQPQS